MTVEEARALAKNITAAADQAEAEGRTELLESDLDAAFGNLDSALAALRQAIHLQPGD